MTGSGFFLTWDGRNVFGRVFRCQTFAQKLNIFGPSPSTSNMSSTSLSLTLTHTRTRTNTHVYLYMYIYSSFLSLIFVHTDTNALSLPLSFTHTQHKHTQTFSPPSLTHTATRSSKHTHALHRNLKTPKCKNRSEEELFPGLVFHFCSLSASTDDN